MKALILYESFYGNTRKIAYAIAKGMSQQVICSVLQVNQVTSSQIKNIDFLVAGSPTIGFHLSPALYKLIDSLPLKFLAGMKIAAFDTRIISDISTYSAQPVYISCYAHSANLIADKLVEKGGQLVALPQGFLVHTPKGPLMDGELHRATLWGALLIINRHHVIGEFHRNRTLR